MLILYLSYLGCQASYSVQILSSSMLFLCDWQLPSSVLMVLLANGATHGTIKVFQKPGAVCFHNDERLA